MMPDCLIIGGGVVGLSLAYELARGGARVRLLDATRPGSEASWAGAGILPPVGPRAEDPVDKLTAVSNRLHAEWHLQLREATGIDNGYRPSGGIYLARDRQAAIALHVAADAWRRSGLDVELIDSRDRLDAIEPGLRLDELFLRSDGLAPRSDEPAAVFLPGECQLRNPRHLQALIAACLALGVEISDDSPVEDFVVRGGRIEAVLTAAGPIAADRFCIASGAWSRELVGRIAPAPAIRPIRGQIALLSLPATPLRRVINEGRRYLVPRDDGRVLVGSTEEDVGFDRGTTAAAIQGLLDLAVGLCPALGNARLERCWAGLRPASADGLPFLGRIADYENAFLAAGHFRAGLQLSTGTALVMARLMRGEAADFDLAPFRLDRPIYAAEPSQSPHSGRTCPPRHDSPAAPAPAGQTPILNAASPIAAANSNLNTRQEVAPQIELPKHGRRAAPQPFSPWLALACLGGLLLSLLMATRGIYLLAGAGGAVAPQNPPPRKNVPALLREHAHDHDHGHAAAALDGQGADDEDLPGFDSPFKNLIERPPGPHQPRSIFFPPPVEP
jgi:glycine oxidase